MKRLALLVVATAAVIALVVVVRLHHKPVEHRPAAIDSTTTDPSSVSSAPTTSRPRAYRSGTVTTVAHTDYGNIRVRVTVAHGRIIRATAVEIPHGNPMDVELSKPAVRQLEQEVLRTQSSDVDAVSGATYTSTGYLNSLQAALDQLS
jgi:uncharacterized protein with FMN-binding domain